MASACVMGNASPGISAHAGPQAGVGEGELVARFAAEAGGRLREFSDVQLAALLWACARLRCRQPWMAAAMARLSRADVAAFSPPAMAGLVWAFARFEHEPGTLPCS